MRFNDKELRQHIKSVPVELEGNLTYFDFKDGAKERRVKLKNSLLLLYKVSANSVIVDLEPSELIVLTDSKIRPGAAGSNSFEIVCKGFPFDNVFTFYCKTPTELQRWLSSLKHSSLNRLELELRRLKQEVKKIEDRKKHHTSPVLFSQQVHAVPSPNTSVRHTILGAPAAVLPPMSGYKSEAAVAPADMPLIDFS